MPLIWNAGAALTVTSFMTMATSVVGAGPRHPAPLAIFPPVPIAVVLADATTHRHYTGLAEHFQAANTSADGKLTREQAQHAGWARVVNHFDNIDTRHMGYVTLQQIHSYNMARRHARRSGSV